LQDLSDTKYVELVVENILSELASPFQVFENVVSVSASIGISFCPQDGTTHETLIKKADQAMYMAKNGGRNQFRFFSPEYMQAAIPHIRHDGSEAC
jgi:diguanylate cyclase (GGDEF)-like protein